MDLPQVDEVKMRMERLQRLQSVLLENDLGGILLYDPINIRYATDARNMQIWTMHNAARYCLVPTEGRDLVFCQSSPDGNFKGPKQLKLRHFRKRFPSAHP